MAKLYWRVKRDGKWTWRAAYVHEELIANQCLLVVKSYSEEEE